jgi:hypothetical protein
MPPTVPRPYTLLSWEKKSVSNLNFSYEEINIRLQLLSYNKIRTSFERDRSSEANSTAISNRKDKCNSLALLSSLPHYLIGRQFDIRESLKNSDNCISRLGHGEIHFSKSARNQARIDILTPKTDPRASIEW